MTSTPLFLYLRLVGQLLHARALGVTTEDTEEEFGLKLNEQWDQMTPEEHAQAEAFTVRRLAKTAPKEIAQVEAFDPSNQNRLPRKHTG